MSTERRLAAQRWDEARREAFLAGNRLFQDLPKRVLGEVAARFRPRGVERGAMVFLSGQQADALNLLAEGRVKVVKETEDGREVILRVISPGDIFGATGGWGEPVYPATAIALEDSVVLRLPTPDFAALVRGHSDFAVAMIRELGSRLREAEARIRELQTQRVERRIAQVLIRLANKTGKKTPAGIEIGVPLSRQDLADLCGTTLSTASRTLSGWDLQGIVEAGRERVVLLKPHLLVAIADDLPPPGGGARE